MTEDYLLLAQEFIFWLGCKVALLADEILPPEGICFRSVRVAAFYPPYLISVLQIGQMAELEFCAEVSCNPSAEEANTKFRWEKSLVAALESKTTLPTELPANFCFAHAKAELSANQINWLQGQMASLQPLSLKTLEEPVSRAYRDGKCYLGGIKINGQQPHIFCLRNGDEDRRQRQYHQTLFELAASVIQEPRSAQVLKNMRIICP